MHDTPILMTSIAFGLAATLLTASTSLAQTEDAIRSDPVAAVLATVSPEARRFHEHATSSHTPRWGEGCRDPRVR